MLDAFKNHVEIIKLQKQLKRTENNINTIDENYVATKGQTEFPIAYETFDYTKDAVFVTSGRTSLSEGLDYTLVAGKVILTEGVPEGRTITIRILKNVRTEAVEPVTSGAYLEDGSVPLDKLGELPIPVSAGGTGVTTVEEVLLNFGLLSEKEIISGFDLNSLTDCNKPPALICYINAWSDGLINAPFKNQIGILFTVWQYTSAVGIEGGHVIQIAVSENGLVYTRKGSINDNAFDDWAMGFLPLTGGALSSGLTLDGKNNDYPQVLLGYRNANTGGKLTFSEIHKFLGLYCNVDGNEATVEIKPQNDLASKLQLNVNNTNWYKIFGEHNKPSGTYTGNGDATERTINIGGIGKSLLIWGDNKYTFLFVTSGGAFRIGSDMHPKYIPYGELDFVGGILRIKSTDQYFNESGTNYNYVVL